MSVADKLGFGPKREVVVHSDGSATIIVTAPEMFVPDAKPVTVKLTPSQYDGYRYWQDGRAMIQTALGDLSAEDREKLMSGMVL